jgi:hypothetical protein
MSAIKINIGIGDSFLAESFLSFILATFFPAIKTSLKLPLVSLESSLHDFLSHHAKIRLCGESPSLKDAARP